jgi:hypothetical protein
MRVLAVFLLFLVLFGHLVLKALDEDTVQYKHQMECVKLKVSHGVPRSAIQLTEDWCEVKK